jgi:hypothetical protein
MISPLACALGRVLLERAEAGQSYSVQQRSMTLFERRRLRLRRVIGQQE